VHDLYATALEFRLSRQRGYHVPQGKSFHHCRYRWLYAFS
jgi:hypothetical protein